MQDAGRAADAGGDAPADHQRVLVVGGRARRLGAARPRGAAGLRAPGGSAARVGSSPSSKNDKSALLAGITRRQYDRRYGRPATSPHVHVRGRAAGTLQSARRTQEPVESPTHRRRAAIAPRSRPAHGRARARPLPAAASGSARAASASSGARTTSCCDRDVAVKRIPLAPDGDARARAARGARGRAPGAPGDRRAVRGRPRTTTPST